MFYFFVRLPFRTSSAISNFLGTEDPPHVVNLAAEKWSRGVEDIVPKRATKKCKVKVIFQWFVKLSCWELEQRRRQLPSKQSGSAIETELLVGRGAEPRRLQFPSQQSRHLVRFQLRRWSSLVNWSRAGEFPSQQSRENGKVLASER